MSHLVNNSITTRKGKCTYFQKSKWQLALPYHSWTGAVPKNLNKSLPYRNLNKYQRIVIPWSNIVTKLGVNTLTLCAVTRGRCLPYCQTLTYLNEPWNENSKQLKHHLVQRCHVKKKNSKFHKNIKSLFHKFATVTAWFLRWLQQYEVNEAIYLLY